MDSIETTTRKLREETIVYENSPIGVLSFYWYSGEVEKFTCGESEGYSFKPYKPKKNKPGTDTPGTFHDSLPVEFFSHELMEVVPEDETSLRRFLEGWGFPFSPARNNPSSLTWIKDESERDTLRRGMECTDSLQGKFEDDSFFLHCFPVISECEAISTIECLQACIRSMFWQIEGEEWERAIFPNWQGFIEAGARHNLEITAYGVPSMNPPRRSTLDSWGLLTSAICNQVIDAIADPAPWRKCVNEKCGRIFKYTRSDAKKPHCDAVYCCKQCGIAKRTRKSRSKKGRETVRE
ncbi:MAG: hypothetical protein ACOYIK_04625 [Coriobacteriales bacterium]|jgi:transposase